MRAWGVRAALLGFACGLLALTFAYPRATLTRDTYSYLFVFDITHSMNVRDTGPRDAPISRIAFAKRATRDTLKRLPCGARAGLAVFTEHRTFLLFAPVEVCENFRDLSAMLEKIDWRMAWAARSEVAKGLYSGLLASKKLGEETRFVFFSDGHEAPPVHQDFRPKFRGTPGDVNGVVVGLGATTPSPIPHLDHEGNITGYWTRDEVLQVDRYSLGRGSNIANEQMAGVDNTDVERRIAQGTEHLSSLKEGYLKQLARETRLEYLRPATTEVLGDFLTGPVLANQQPVVTDLRWLPALIALLSVVAAYLPLPVSNDETA